MDVNMFYIYQIGWYVFGTFVAFVAALMFWKKGRAEVKGKTLELGLGLKLTGVGGIFVAVLVVLHLINPLKPFFDYKKIFLVYSGEKISEHTGNRKVEYKIIPSQFSEDIEFDSNKLDIELIPWEYVYSFLREEGSKSYVTREAIPNGKYKIFFIQRDTGVLDFSTVEVSENK